MIEKEKCNNLLVPMQEKDILPRFDKKDESIIIRSVFARNATKYPGKALIRWACLGDFIN